jgi:hypothetical protein
MISRGAVRARRPPRVLARRRLARRRLARRRLARRRLAQRLLAQRLLIQRRPVHLAAPIPAPYLAPALTFAGQHSRRPGAGISPAEVC